MRFPTALTAASLVLVTMSAAACSNGSKTSAAAPSTSSSAAAGAGASTATSAANNGASSSVNVCALLTADQASSVVGVTFTAATPGFGGKVCMYAGPTVPMTVTLTPNAGSAAAWTNELSTLGSDGVAAVTIGGVGDRAAETTGSLGTQSGDWIIQVDSADESSVNGGNIGGDFTKSIAVAKAVIAALH